MSVDLIKIIGLTILGFLIQRLKTPKEILKSRFLYQYILYLLHSTFVWNMPLATVVQTFPHFCFFTFVSLRWRSLYSYSLIGYLNFIITLLSAIYIVLIQIFLYRNRKLNFLERKTLKLKQQMIITR